MHNFSAKNKHLLLPLMFLLFIGCGILLACAPTPATETAPESTDLSTYPSGAAPEDCLLCGNGSGTLLPVYSGQNNIGIVSLNTFQIVPVSINLYDDNGNLIEEPSDGHSTHITNTGDNGFLLIVSEDTDRGIARGTLSFNQDEFLDMDKAASHLCSNCLSQAMENSSITEPTGMCVIDFYNNNIRMLRKNITAFQFDDYYVSCRSRERQTNDITLEMDLLIFYCPKRYGE